MGHGRGERPWVLAAPLHWKAARFLLLVYRWGVSLETLVPLALFVGLVFGYLVGRLQGRAVLVAYKAGLEDARRGEGGPCWVRGQVDARVPGPPP